MLVCLFNSLNNGEYLNLLTAAVFSNIHFSGKTSSSAKNSDLQLFSR